MSEPPPQERATKRPKKGKCVRFQTPQVTQMYHVPTTLGEFLTMYSTTVSNLKITSYKNDKKEELTSEQIDTLKQEHVFPDTGKLKNVMKIRQKQYLCSQKKQLISNCETKMCEIDEALDYGDYPELEEGFRIQFLSLEDMSKQAKSDLAQLQKTIQNVKSTLFNKTKCPSQHFLHILITNPTIVCPYKNKPQVEVVKDTILETFMCVQTPQSPSSSKTS